MPGVNRSWRIRAWLFIQLFYLECFNGKWKLDMSYKKPDTGNSMNDYFTRVMDFHRLAFHLLNANTISLFEIWLDKLIQIDRRSLVLYLRINQNQIPLAHWERAESRLGRLLTEAPYA